MDWHLIMIGTLLQIVIPFNGFFVHGVTLTPRSVDVLENTEVTLTCTNHVKYDVGVAWTRNDITVAMNHNGTKCNAYGFLTNQTLYAYSCLENNTYSVTLKKINRAGHGEKWKCKDIYGNESNVMTIFVKVPANTVTISPNQTVYTKMENTSLSTVQCTSNECRPVPVIMWYTDYNTDTREDDILLWEDIPNSMLTRLIQTYTSELNYTAHRSLNGSYLFCVVNNSLDEIIISDKILLNITYPPDKPPRIVELETVGEYRVMEGRYVTLTCSVTGGNPLPQLHWSRRGNESTSFTHNTVTKTITWQAKRVVSDHFSCTSIHLAKNETTGAQITVLYPPDKPFITMKTWSGTYINLTNSINVIEQKMFTVSCNASSNPPVSRIQWSGLQIQTESDLYIGKANRSNTNLTCEVFNEMRDIYMNQTVTGTNRTRLKVNVLYPPKVDILSDEMKVHEGEKFTFSCDVINGNPNITKVLWRRTNQTFDGPHLVLNNVSRNQAGVYQCCASNHMVSSDGRPEIGNDSVNLQLQVEYAAKVLYFIANNTSESPTVNENYTLNVTCEIEGNPIPEGEMKFQAASFVGNNLVKEKMIIPLIQTSSKLHLTTSLYAKCTDTGQYMCTGWNKFSNGLKTKSARNFTLLVKCRPRKSPYHEIPDRVFSDVTHDVTLSFTALAYPVPPESGYIWSKKTVNGEWTTINVSFNNDKIVIATSGLKSYLTIKNITELDYGLYKLRVENDIGVYQHTFNLTAKDVDKKESFQLGLAAIGAIGSVSLLVVMVVAIAVYKRRGVKKKRKNACHEAKEEHIYQNVNKEMTEKLDQASKVQIARKSLLAKLSPLSRKPATTEVTNASKEGNNYADILELEDFNQSEMVDHHGEIQALVHNSDVKDFDDHGDFQAIHQHGDSQYDHDDFQHLRHFDGLQELEQYDDQEELDVDEPTRAEYGNTLEIVKLIERVHVTELFSYLTGITKDYFETQFTKLPKGLTKTYSFSQKPENVPLNRYHGIYPYDHSRVKIPDIPDFFINACYIDGFEREKAYIACLGPMANTTKNFELFWQMVWSEKSDVIVMLTMLVEHSGIKCDQYWPNNGTSISYGDFILTSAEEEIYSDYVIRKLQISKGDEIRNVTHFHFTAWPDKSVPEDVTCLLEFRRRVRKLHLSGPLIVHCSAGIGRTGTLIAIDILVEEGRSQGSVNVLECVKNMREQRVNMVQTLEQYHFIYKTLVNALVFDNDAITTNDLCTYTDISKTTNFSEMFQKLGQSVESDSTEERRTRNVNTEYRYGNRDGSDIPGDAHRVRLFLSREMNSSDYINAVYVNSYTKADHFIVAQSPLPNSVEDFLCLIYQTECTCVVSMDGELEGQIAGLYLPPDNSNLTVGNFTVTARRLDTKDCCIVRQVKIALNGMFKGAEKVLYHFQYTGWLNGHRVPSCPKKFVEFVRNVETCFQQFGKESCHILVHCINAFERSCLFCAVVALTETVQHEGEVCIPNTLRRIRTRRRRAFPNMEQFRFCFQAGRAYIETETKGDNTYMICY